MYGSGWAILLMYGSHDMRHTLRRWMVVNETPGFWGVIEVHLSSINLGETIKKKKEEMKSPSRTVQRH